MNQQDAQEFMTYVLDLMHEEFVSVSLSNQSTHNKPKDSKEREKEIDLKDSKEKADEWEEVGKKNKSSIVLTVDPSLCFFFASLFVFLLLLSLLY